MPKAIPKNNLQVRVLKRAKTNVIELPYRRSTVKETTPSRGAVYCSPTTVEFFPFDEDYLLRLQEGDPETVAHFFAYFTRLLRIKLRARRLPQQSIDDIVQETFMLALVKVKASQVRDPNRLGAYVNGICNNLIREHYRHLRPHETIDQDGFDVPDGAIDLEHVVLVNEIKERVRKVLAKMPDRDREILKAVYLDERNKDEICREHHVDRGYLRVLLYRALRSFRDLYAKH